jgi:hypothetical protein
VKLGCTGRAALAEPLRRLCAECRRALRLLVHADVGVEPPVLTLLVDFAFAGEEARIQPAVRLRFGRQLNAREDRTPVTGRTLLDALAVDRKE